MSTYSYIVTSQKPTSVSHSIVCNFTSSQDSNLILSRGNHLEVHTLREDGLQSILDTTLFGTINSIDYFRPNNSNQDLLFVLTEKKHFCIYGFDSLTQKLVAKAAGNVKDRLGREIESGQRGFVDPDYRVIGMLIYECQLKVLPIESSGVKDSFNLHFDETRILDIVFLYGCAKPTVWYNNNNNYYYY
jgi:DNA damage-binding protein 1